MDALRIDVAGGNGLDDAGRASALRMDEEFGAGVETALEPNVFRSIPACT